VVKIEGAVLFGRTVLDGVLFPVFALVLRWWQTIFAAPHQGGRVQGRDPDLMSLVLIRLACACCRRRSRLGLDGAIERTLSWMAWIAVLLWITACCPRCSNNSTACAGR